MVDQGSVKHSLEYEGAPEDWPALAPHGAKWEEHRFRRHHVMRRSRILNPPLQVMQHRCSSQSPSSTRPIPAKPWEPHLWISGSLFEAPFLTGFMQEVATRTSVPKRESHTQTHTRVRNLPPKARDFCVPRGLAPPGLADPKRPACRWGT